MKVKWLSHVQLFETPWTAAYPAPPSMGFSRQEYWSGLPLVNLEGVIKFFKLAFVSFCHSLKLVSSFTELGSEICRDFFLLYKVQFRGFLGGSVVKNPPCHERDTGSIPNPGRSHMPLNN